MIGLWRVVLTGRTGKLRILREGSELSAGLLYAVTACEIRAGRRPGETVELVAPDGRITVEATSQGKRPG